MRYSLKQIHCRPWLLNGLSLKLIESHYENNYGGALRRLNAITEQLESLDFAKTPGYVDPDRLHEWIGDLSKSKPVVVYCAYGFHVGCTTAAKLREAGFDAKYRTVATRDGRRSAGRCGLSR